MRHPGLDVIEQTMLRTHQIAVAHQCDPFTINTDNAMHHIPTAVHPCQHHVAGSVTFTPSLTSRMASSMISLSVIA